MTTLAGIRNGLNTRLSTITALRKVYTRWPGNLAVTPAVIIGTPSGVYDRELGGSHTLTVPVYVLATTADVERSQDLLDVFIDDTSASSIRVAVNADPTLGGVVDSTAVLGFEGYGAGYDVGGDTFVGVQLNLEVFT